MPFLVKRGPRFVTQPGVDYGGPGEIIAQNPQAIGVKWPRGKHSTANGAPTTRPASTMVYTTLQKLEDAVTLGVQPVIQWDHIRKIKDQE